MTQTWKSLITPWARTCSKSTIKTLEQFILTFLNEVALVSLLMTWSRYFRQGNNQHTKKVIEALRTHYRILDSIWIYFYFLILCSKKFFQVKRQMFLTSSSCRMKLGSFSFSASRSVICPSGLESVKNASLVHFYHRSLISNFLKLQKLRFFHKFSLFYS